MPHLFHLSYRNGWYCLRFRIPHDLTTLFKRREVCKSLKTKDKKAEQLMLEIYMPQANQLFSSREVKKVKHPDTNGN